MKSKAKKFSAVSSLKEFSKVLWREVFTSGEEEQTIKYYKITAKVNMVDIRETEKPHSPLVEMIFVSMACLLFTILFKCAMYSMKPIMFDISGDDTFINMVMLFFVLGLIALEFRKLYRTEPR